MILWAYRGSAEAAIVDDGDWNRECASTGVSVSRGLLRTPDARVRVALPFGVTGVTSPCCRAVNESWRAMAVTGMGNGLRRAIGALFVVGAVAFEGGGDGAVLNVLTGPTAGGSQPA